MRIDITDSWDVAPPADEQGSDLGAIEHCPSTHGESYPGTDEQATKDCGQHQVRCDVGIWKGGEDDRQAPQWPRTLRTANARPICRRPTAMNGRSPDQGQPDREREGLPVVASPAASTHP